MRKQQALVGSVVVLTSVLVVGFSLPYLAGDFTTWWKQQTSDQLPSENPDYLMQVSNSYYREGQFALARDVANRAIIVKPDFLPAHKMLAAILLKEKKYTEAAALCRKVAKIFPSDNSIQIALGMALSGQGRLSEAEDAYKRVMSDKDASIMHLDEAQQQLQALEEKPGKKASDHPDIDPFLQPSPSPKPVSSPHPSNMPTVSPLSPLPPKNGNREGSQSNSIPGL